MKSYAAPPQASNNKFNMSAGKTLADFDREERLRNQAGAELLREEVVDFTDCMTQAKSMLLNMDDFATLLGKDNIICESEDQLLAYAVQYLSW